VRETRLIMGMPITVDVVEDVDGRAAEAAFQYFNNVDERFSPYKPASELSAMNRGELRGARLSAEMTEVLGLAELTRHETAGYFVIARKPSAPTV